MVSKIDLKWPEPETIVNHRRDEFRYICRIVSKVIVGWVLNRINK